MLNMLRAIYKTGSSCILKKYNDVDVVRFYDTREEAKDALIHYPHDDTNDVHFDYVRPLKVFLGCYIYPFMQLIEGEDLHLGEFDMFNADVKKDYVECLKRHANRFSNDYKGWYHILTAIYLYDNGKYELTDEQLNNIQKAHDEGIENNIKDFCISKLNAL